MNLQRDVVEQRLAKLRSIVRDLEDLAAVDREEFVESTRDRWAAERGLQLAAEALFDVGSHVLVSEFNANPSDYESIISGLSDHDVITDALESRLAGLGGFRNLLVHDYLDVDPYRVHDYLDDRRDAFIDFAAEIDEFLEVET